MRLHNNGCGDYNCHIMLVIITTLVLGTQTITAVSTPIVIADSNRLPPAGSAWKGDAPHHFLDEQVTLFCGSHGTISGNGDPPDQKGQSSVIQYKAVFTGELTLNPPLAENTRSYPISDPIRMTERITSRGSRGATRNYDTELTAVVFSGADFPENVSVRESPRRRSLGTASIGRTRQGTYKIQSSYEVWLEVSVDGGRSWHLASDAVTMKLAPETKAAAISTREVID